MASTTPVEIIDDDDDDEFDWEAAVKEIDVACHNNGEDSCSILAPPDNTSVVDNLKDLCPASNNNTNNKKPATSRQSTLDRYIGKAGPKPEPENRTEVHDESVSCIDIDAEAAKTWIYPVNVPLRDYQFAITKTALFSNTLVALPTGLGKTLIAAVVMYNYFRWFPDGKIVFAAPSRPLVMQQIEACHNIVGIAQEWTTDMTGQISPAKRACYWRTKRVFFVTPQVLEKDIQSGTCLAKDLVCLVIDEAHRALGNYSYCVAVRELMTVPVQLRILALTATPGSKHEAIQHIIDNLQISTLEYRNENDPDVSPYVHNRKLELIEVEMGQDAVEINNLLLEVIRPYVARLYAIGLLQNRDYQTLSPCDLLNSRDRFRQAPPPNLPEIKYGEVEGYFGALITLYHIRKLLSSHGIRPAYEMLEDKLKQGHFARFMCKNENTQKVKLLMQQSLSHGAPSPKLSKLLEILVDHFKTRDPQSSRVIIFTNFRGSVRDIMNALANIGGLVKATEFIGQSSGKSLKGQSQKVQQAVLEKFRAGGYNVIVATSIGEEGLDIMEVDLVICFDANVSPLRMIQRMGRTGRKHDGRVVVLACQGSELKGYMRKQANSRAIKKHMRNGGMNSFSFHSSPRMVPHIFKPEVRFIELSIEKFVPRGKKVKGNHANQSPLLKENLTAAQTDLLAKYFCPARKNNWRPSLIAFPHFQAIPSRVDKVMHSYRTGMLIDMMQRLRGLSSSADSKKLFIEVEVPSAKCLEVETVEQHDDVREDCFHSKALDIADLPICQAECIKNSTMPIPCKSDAEQVILDVVEEVPETPDVEKNLLNGENSISEMHDAGETKAPLMLADEYSNDFKDTELSPRLTNMIETGVVPESPINDSGLAPDAVSPTKLHAEWLLISSSPGKNENSIMHGVACGKDASVHPISDEISTPLLKTNHISHERECISTSPVAALPRTPMANLTNISCSSDWHLSSGGISENVKRLCKFKRLRKVGDIEESRNPNCTKENSSIPEVNLTRSCNGARSLQIKHRRGKTRMLDDARAFIEEEAEVCSEAEVSADEEDEKDIDSYDDSFIDDRINPTAATTQAEHGRIDMMAIYRRSLLSQSPMQMHPNCSAFSPDGMASVTRMTESGSSSGKTSCSLQTPPTKSEDPSVRRNAESFDMNQGRLSSEAIPCADTERSANTERKMESRKRKLSFYQARSIPAINLEQKFSLQSENTDKEPFHLLKSEQKISYHSEHTGQNTFQLGQADNTNANAEVLDDDLFYESLDLDAVEAQATLLLKHKSEMSTQKREMLPQKNNLQDLGLQHSPSFDLGIW